MNRLRLQAAASDWLLPDLLSIVFEYAKYADHRFSSTGNEGDAVVINNGRTAIAKTINSRVWMTDAIERTDRVWTINIVSDYNSNVKIGFGDAAAGRSYTVNLTDRRLSFGRGFDGLPAGYGLYWPEHMEPGTYKFPTTMTVRFVVDVWLRRKPTGKFPHDPTAKHFGLQMYTKKPPRSAVYSLANVRIEVDGLYRGSFRYVPNCDELRPFVQLQKAMATIVDDESGLPSVIK